MRRVFQEYHESILGEVRNVGFARAYRGSAPFPATLEVETVRKAFGRPPWHVEVNHRELATYLGPQADLFRDAMAQRWGSPRFRIDAASFQERVFVEVKLCKLDKINGTSGGRCLYDIGGFAKDIDRLLMVKHHLRAHACYFVVTGLYRNEPDSPFDALIKKVGDEMQNDTRGRRELQEKAPYRRRQRRILAAFLKLSKRDVSVLRGEQAASFLLNIDKLGL